MSTSPQLPIIIAEDEDVSIFESIKSTESYIEAIDVDDDVYRAWDSQGRVLSITADPPYNRAITRPVHISSAVPEQLEPEQLQELLTRVLRRHIDQNFNATSLEETIIRFIDWQGIRT